MRTIMTLVLDESEDISQQLLSVLLTSLRREKRVDGSHLPTSLPTSVVANDVLPHSEFANMNEGGQVSPDHKQLNGNEVKSVPEEHEKDDNEGLLQKSCNSNAKETGKENNSDIPSLGTVKLHKGRRRGHSKKSTGAVKPEHDNAQDSKILESEKPSDQVGGVVKGEPNKLLDSKNLEADKPSDEVAAVVKIEANKSRDSRNLEADKPSDQVAGVEKIQPDNLQDSRSLESDKPSDRVKNRRESRKAALLELFKSADKNQVGSDPETLLSSKRKRGRSSKEAKHVPSPGQSTKDAIGLGSPARSNEETVGLISPARSNEETLGLSSPAQSNKETVVLGPPDQSSKEAAGYASPARSNKETVGLVSVARSNKVVVGSASPARSSKETAALASPAQSTKQSVRLASPARSSKDTASLASPSQKQSPPEDGRTESSRPRRGRPKSAGRKLDVKEESVLPGLTPVTTERVSDGLAATEMTPRSPNSNQEMETSKDSVTKSSKRSKRRLDPSHDNTPKSMDKISHGIPVASGETDTPDANQEDGYRPKKMQKVTSLPQSAEKNSSEAGESSKRTPRNSTKKKSISGMEKTPEAAGEGSAEDEKFVGRRIKVWWPRDKHPVKKKRSSTGDGLVVREEKMESPAKRGSSSSKNRKETRRQSDIGPDDNGALIKGTSAGASEMKTSGASTDSTVLTETTVQPKSGTRGRQQKQGEGKRGGRRSVSGTPTNGTVKAPKGAKGANNAMDRDKTGVLSEPGSRNLTVVHDPCAMNFHGGNDLCMFLNAQMLCSWSTGLCLLVVCCIFILNVLYLT